MHDAFADWQLAALAPHVFDWCYRDRVRAAIAEELSREWAEYGAVSDAVRAWHARMAIPGTVPEDFLLQPLEVDGVRLLAQIRFFGGDRARPFADVRAQSAPIAATSLPELCAALAHRFRVFAPQRARLRLDASLALPMPAATADVYFVAGAVASLRAASPPEAFDRVRLVPEEPTAYYEEYLAMYRELFEERPYLRGHVPVETLATLQESHREGFCVRIVVDGDFAGVAAARPAVQEGIAGWLVTEEILAKRARGQRLGPAVQRRMVELLDPARGAILFGMIDARNVASLNTAARSGRRPVAGWFFLPLATGA